MDNIQEQIIELEREILELKTAQPIPGMVEFYRGLIDIPAMSYNGTYTWTIKYKDVGDTSEPIAFITFLSDRAMHLLPYDAETNTQKIEYHSIGGTIFVATWQLMVASRPIESITRDF